jgi:hypothetical protein
MPVATRFKSTLRKLTIGFGVALFVAAMPATARARLRQHESVGLAGGGEPYFLLAVDTSGSMLDPVGSSTTCTVNGTNFGTDRRAHARCALQKTILAYSGQVNFGLMTYALRQSTCTDAAGVCQFGTCTYNNVSNNSGIAGCGPEPGALPLSTRAGSHPRAHAANISSPTSSVNNLLAWVDGSCADNREIFASSTPLNGILRDGFRYYSNNGLPSPNPGGAT